MRWSLAWGLTLALSLGPAAPAAPAADQIRRGLTTEIFAGENFDRLVASRIDANIECFWEDSPPADGAPADHFSVRWSGWIKPPKAGRYKFYVAVDDGVRLWIDGERVINQWTGGSRVTECSLELTEEPHAIRVEYLEVTGPSWIGLLWVPLGAPHMAVVPADVLFQDEASAAAKPRPLPKTGLVAEYFDVGFRRKLRSGETSRTEAVWGDGAPAWDLPTNLSARYTGFLVPPVTGRYQFTGYADDRMGVWIDGKPLLANDISRRKRETAFVELEANVPVPLRIEFTDRAGWASYYLHWMPPKWDKEVSIPPDCLFQTRTAAAKRAD